MTNILVIKHGALGDIILSMSAFAAIRAHFSKAHITLLTSKTYADLLRNTPFFDEVWVDTKPKPWQLRAVFALRRMLSSKPFDWVFDLQTSQRSSSYLSLFRAPKPKFSGVNPRGSHAYTDPARHQRHAFDNLVEQLKMAAITLTEPPDLRWMQADISRFSLPTRFALLVAGGAAHRPEKRWPAAHYGALAQQLAAQGMIPVLIGTQAEAEELAAIAETCPQAVNLCGQTSITEIAALAQHAQCAVGNDTGPMHIIAAARCPSLVLFSAASKPEYSSPVGTHVRCLQRADLAILSVEDVLANLPVSA
jgi:ADP-heptose:LPS heptosyltransferase